MSSHEFVEDDGTREIDFLYGDLEVDINKQVSCEEVWKYKYWKFCNEDIFHFEYNTLMTICQKQQSQ